MRGGTTQPVILKGPLRTGGLRFNSCHVAGTETRFGNRLVVYGQGTRRLRRMKGYGWASKNLSGRLVAEDLAST